MLINEKVSEEGAEFRDGEGMLDKFERIKAMAYEKFGRKSIRLMGLIMLMTILLCIVIGIGQKEDLFDGNRLKRGDVGEGDTVYELLCVDEETKETKECSITVSERRCSDDELDAYFDAIYEKLEEQVLASNPSLEEVSEDLVLSDRIDGTPVTVEWIDTDRTYLYSDGSLKQENISGGEIISLTARLTYYDEVRIYTFFLKLVPNSRIDEKESEEELAAALAGADMSSIDEEWIELPATVGTRAISWSSRRDSSCVTIALLGTVATLAVPLADRAERKKKEKQRRQQMLSDYPDIISKFILLITAGMTCRSAWTKICRDYKEKTDRKRAAYDEMQITLGELELGKPEALAYEEFGRRCDMHAYQRFGTLLANNLKRGSSDILSLLALESKEAFDSRKEEVQKRVEEAETKLLGPMAGMLGIVIAIVVVPAFAAFG